MVSIIICTYNRAQTLKLCLEKIMIHGGSFLEKIEVIIVDNNSTDDTKKVCSDFISLNINYILEENIGLSFARNTGAHSAKYNWLFYLDDDALLLESTLRHLFKTIENDRFDFFGGLYKAKYLTEKPKWIHPSFGASTTSLSQLDELPEDENIIGLIMVIKKDLLVQLGMFDTSLGMSGNIIGYGEETELQKRAKSFGIRLGLNPFFIVEHIVGEHKHKLSWHLKSYFFLARDRAFFNKDININIPRTIILLPFRICKYFLKMILVRDFYFENFIWYSFNNTMIILGKLASKLKKKNMFF